MINVRKSGLPLVTIGNNLNYMVKQNSSEYNARLVENARQTPIRQVLFLEVVHYPIQISIHPALKSLLYSASDFGNGRALFLGAKKILSGDYVGFVGDSDAFRIGLL